MLLYLYVARTDTHSFISNVFIYRFFFKKKNPAWHKDLSNYLKTAATEDKLGLEASSAEVLWGGAQKTISASTSGRRRMTECISHCDVKSEKLHKERGLRKQSGVRQGYLSPI